VDLKADRGRGVLMVRAAYGEPGISVPQVCAALADELRSMADWLGLDHVEVDDKGDLGRALKRAVRH
jgi:uncharacterized protein YcaQ